MKRTRLLATVTLMVAMFMDLMDSTITVVALPALGAELDATPAQLEWTIAGYLIPFSTLLITGGRLGDIYGRRRIFVLGVLGFTIASLLASLSSTAAILVVWRIFQGACAGIMVPQVLSSVQVMYKPDERAPIFGIIGALSALGSIGGLVLGGWLITADFLGTGWRSIFLINIPIGLMLVIAAAIFIPDSRSTNPLKLDLKGVLLGSIAVFLVIFPLTEGEQVDWAWWIWSMFALAPLMIWLFVRQQQHKLAADGSALLPIPLFRNHGFSSGLLVQVLAAIGNGGYPLILLFYIQTALEFTPLSAGLTLLPIAIGSLIATPIATTLTRTLGKQAVLIGGITQAAAFGWAALTINVLGNSLSGWHLTPALTLAGIGMMVMIMPQTSIALGTVPVANAGAASGTLTTFNQIGMALGVTAASTVYFGTLDGTLNPRSSVVVALLVSITAYFLAALGSLTMPNPRKPAVTDKKAPPALSPLGG